MASSCCIMHASDSSRASTARWMSMLLPSTLHDFSNPPCSQDVIVDMDAQVAVLIRAHVRQQIAWPRSLDKRGLSFGLACRDARMMWMRCAELL
jgi:hypothetical protein